MTPRNPGRLQDVNRPPRGRVVAVRDVCTGMPQRSKPEVRPHAVPCSGGTGRRGPGSGSRCCARRQGHARGPSVLLSKYCIQYMYVTTPSPMQIDRRGWRVRYGMGPKLQVARTGKTRPTGGVRHCAIRAAPATRHKDVPLVRVHDRGVVGARRLGRGLRGASGPTRDRIACGWKRSGRGPRTAAGSRRLGGCGLLVVSGAT